MLKKISISIVILLLICVGFEKLFSFLIKQNMNLKISYVQKEKVDADILIMGSCEPLWMISPKIIEKKTALKTYNLSLSHSDFSDVFLSFYLYLKNNKSPQYVFLFVTPESIDENYNMFHSYFFSPYIGDRIIDSVVKEMDPEYFKYTNIPFLKYAYYNNNVNFAAFQGFKHFIQNKKTPYHVDGYEIPNQMNWDNHFAIFMKQNPNGWKYKWSGKREKYLRKTIALAQKNQIKIYLFESPLLNEIKPFQLNRKACLDKIELLAKDYKTDYLLFDTMQIANSKKYFMSPLITNVKGSDLFTNMFGNYICDNIIKVKKKCAVIKH
jgi:hypothetical protein